MKMTSILTAAVLAAICSTGVQAQAVQTGTNVTALELTETVIQNRFDGIVGDTTLGNTPVGPRDHPDVGITLSQEIIDALNPTDLTYSYPDQSINFSGTITGDTFTLASNTRTEHVPVPIDPQEVANLINDQFYGDISGFTSLGMGDGKGVSGVIPVQIDEAYLRLDEINVLAALVPNNRRDDPRSAGHWINFDSSVTRLQADLKRINGDIDQVQSLVNGVLANL